MYKFYIRMDGDVYGPYSAKGMMELELLPDIMVTEFSMNSWVPAGELNFVELAKKELVEKLKATPKDESTSSLEERREALKRKLTPKEFLSGDTSNKTSVVKSTVSFPERIEFKANFNEGINSIGGRIFITPTQLIFHPHAINFGDLSDRVFNICDITGYDKGILSFMYITFKNGNRIKLTVWNKQNIINELEARRAQLI